MLRGGESCSKAAAFDPRLATAAHPGAAPLAVPCVPNVLFQLQPASDKSRFSHVPVTRLSGKTTDFEGSFESEQREAVPDQLW